MTSRRAVLQSFGTMAMASVLVPSAQAQTQGAGGYPSRPVTLVVPFTANSGSDIIARIIGPRLSAKWGQPVIVDNRPGASGNLGSALVAKAAPDGYSLLMIINTFTITPSLYANLPFDPIKDFAPVAKLGESISMILTVNPNFPARDMKEFIAVVKANAGKFNYASPGNGTPHHLMMELLKSNLGLDIIHVPYKGISGALTEVMGGQVQMMFASGSTLQPFAGTGKLRFIAVAGDQRATIAPEVPTFQEQGVANMNVLGGWYGVLAPAKTPQPLLDKLHEDFVAVMNDPDVKADMTRAGLRVTTSSAPELAALIKSDMDRWGQVVAKAGIKAD